MERSNIDVISELFRAEDWVMADSFREIEAHFEDPMAIIGGNIHRIYLWVETAGIEVNNLDNTQ